MAWMGSGLDQANRLHRVEVRGDHGTRIIYHFQTP